ARAVRRPSQSPLRRELLHPEPQRDAVHRDPCQVGHRHRPQPGGCLLLGPLVWVAVMGVLKARVGGSWVDIGVGSPDEGYVGDSAPTNAGVQLWYDTDAVPTVTAVPWIAPTLLNGWTIYQPGSGYSVPGYRKVGDIVYIRGMVTGGTMTSGIAILTLPVGYRIPGGAYFMIAAAGTPTAKRLQVNTSGDLLIPSALDSNAWLNLDGIFFSVTA